MPTPEELIADHDKEKRIAEEKEILDLVERAEEGDYATLRKAQLWQIKETVAQGVLLRTLVESLPLYRKTKDCLLARADKKFPVKIFGVTWSMPVSVGILSIAFMVFMFCRARGWM